MLTIKHPGNLQRMDNFAGTETDLAQIFFKNLTRADDRGSC